MKVTALIDDDLVENVKKIAKGKTITDSLVIALKEWVSTKRLLELSEEVKKHPVQFKGKDPAKISRSASRRRS